MLVVVQTSSLNKHKQQKFQAMLILIEPRIFKNTGQTHMGKITLERHRPIPSHLHQWNKRRPKHPKHHNPLCQICLNPN